MLYPLQTLRHNALYILLIVLLMLSQMEGYMTALHAVAVPSVPWFRERLLNSISLGSLLAVHLTRTALHNLSSGGDAYVATNCLAALANMGSTIKRLHPHAARALVSLYDAMSKKYVRLARCGGAASDANEVESPELTAHADLTRMALEVLNVALATPLGTNEHLVYALLEREHVFAPLRRHARFWDLVENVYRVVDHFRVGLAQAAADVEGGSGEGEGDEPTWSIGGVLAHIRTASRQWSVERLQHLPDPRYTYEQEEAPEEFFTPYVWSVVVEQCGLSWRRQRVVLVSPEESEYGAGVVSSLPFLSQ
jgi:hypothetical protein